MALSANIYPSRRALALLGDMEDQDRNTRDFHRGTGSYKKNMNMDVALIDPMDIWHGMMVMYRPIGPGGTCGDTNIDICSICYYVITQIREGT